MPTVLGQSTVDEDTAPVATPPAHDPFADGHLDPVRNLAVVVVVVVVVVAVVVAVVVIVVEVVVEPPLRFVIPTWRQSRVGCPAG